ncbi:RecX family transcriptional regulator [Myxococcota bacterium]|nr:RecX family transcriptional regulator [Myxococcota bacterium]
MRRPKRPARTDPEALNAAALRYVERYAATAASLRRVLVNRVRRHAPDTLTEATPHIDAIVERFERARLVDDRVFAAAKASSLTRAGASARMIREKLALKGVKSDLIGETLAELGDARDVELRAAVAYARRRRLGPFARERTDDARREDRDRELAALARRGFSFEIARRVIDASDADALDADR